MGEPERPSWTFGVTLDHPLAIFCPHHAEHVSKKEEASGSSGGAIGEGPGSGGGEGVTTGVPRASQLSPAMDPRSTAAGEATGAGAPAVAPAVSLPSTRGCPVMSQDADPATAMGSVGGEPNGDGGATLAPGCPIKKGAAVNPSNNMLIQEKQLPSPGQATPLPTERRVSTIPKTTEHNPQHQQDDSQFWEYPSQQMFYNAMKRKGHSPTEGEMSTIVGMHNAVNERSWGELLHWEHQLHPETADVVRLKKFSGDATKISPKARLRALFGSELPFDRHDWIVVRGEGGEEVRYVIDFYQAKAQGAAPIAFHLDVRPAVDSFSSAFDRVRMSFRKLTGEAQRFAAVRQSETVAATAGTLPPGPLQRKVSSRWSNTGTSTS
eukprot:m.420104 g.420104  ORF g.420104 m.420104 type:complete len:379 (+) comp32201_c0_seq1:141-1277(+)